MNPKDPIFHDASPEEQAQFNLPPNARVTYLSCGMTMLALAPANDKTLVVIVSAEGPKRYHELV